MEHSEPFLTPALEFYLKWAKEHALGNGGYPVQGFGSLAPDGTGPTWTLWLPSHEVKAEWTFEGGEAVEKVSRVVDDPAVIALADRLIASVAAPQRRNREIIILLMKYAAALIRLNYKVTDAEMTRLLRGTAWHDGVVLHAMGGPERIEQLLALEMPREHPKLPIVEAVNTPTHQNRLKRAIATIFARGR